MYLCIPFFLQKHPHCAKLNHVAFPLYDGLACVFGKGRATGKCAVGLEELNRVCEPTVDIEGMMMDWTNIEAPNEQPEFGDEGNNPNDHTSEGRRKRGVGARRLKGNRIDEQRTRNVDAEMSGVDVKQSYNQRGPA
ncbi:hypothetical protein LINPERHAP1_LOCUS22983 [Linum perenne]